jgi:hypothetical protein
MTYPAAEKLEIIRVVEQVDRKSRSASMPPDRTPSTNGWPNSTIAGNAHRQKRHGDTRGRLKARSSGIPGMDTMGMDKPGPRSKHR